MFSVLYVFEVKKGRDNDFVNGWKGLTQLIYEFEGSYGSRLHQNKNGDYVAYAVWPDRKTWENAGANLPDEANSFRKLMRNSCTKIETEYELEEVENLIQNKIFK